MWAHVSDNRVIYGNNVSFTPEPELDFSVHYTLHCKARLTIPVREPLYILGV